MLPPLPAAWHPLLHAATQTPSFRALEAFLAAEAAEGQVVLPPPADRFRALELTPPEAVRVVLLGQDPYPTPGDAHGLCFSVTPDRRTPRSLRNVYRELATDVPGFRAPDHGHLEAWARRGLLMLNTVLTVRAHAAHSHRKQGWEDFTDHIIAALNARTTPVVFLLWGNAAHAKADLVTADRHAIVRAAHPSPLSARHFLGCRCFSAVTQHLERWGQPPFDWSLPEAAPVEGRLF
ncbi:MAG: uracil-DNA glycosylase [Opitutaceae bacterium]